MSLQPLHLHKRPRFEIQSLQPTPLIRNLTYDLWLKLKVDRSNQPLNLSKLVNKIEKEVALHADVNQYIFVLFTKLVHKCEKKLGCKLSFMQFASAPISFLNKIQQQLQWESEYSALEAIYMQISDQNTDPEIFSGDKVTDSLKIRQWLRDPLNLPRIQQVKMLDLDKLELRALPKELALFTNLALLKLNENKFSKFPSVLLFLNNLKHLGLAYNKIDSLPDYLHNFSELKSLDLASNCLQSIPSSISNLTSLESLDLSENDLKALPPELAACKNLSEIDLSINDFESFPEVVCDLPNLKRINISHNQLSDLPSSFLKLKKLQWLDVSSNVFEFFPMQTEFLPKLQMLGLDDNILRIIPEKIINKKSLLGLYLNKNPLAFISDAHLENDERPLLEEDLDVLSNIENIRKHYKVFKEYPCKSKLATLMQTAGTQKSYSDIMHVFSKLSLSLKKAILSQISHLVKEESIVIDEGEITPELIVEAIRLFVYGQFERYSQEQIQAMYLAIESETASGKEEKKEEEAFQPLHLLQIIDAIAFSFENFQVGQIAQVNDEEEEESPLPYQFLNLINSFALSEGNSPK